MKLDDLQRSAQVSDRAAMSKRRNRRASLQSSTRICVPLSMNIADDALHLSATTNTAF
jgi:hypothetical protein